jgi:uncharacterized protein (UPF0335 family)
LDTALILHRRGQGQRLRRRMRKQDANERAEEETILETYMQALGML